MPSNQPCPPGCTCGRHNRATYGGKPVMTPEERREHSLAYYRQYRAANRQKLAAQQRARYTAGGEAAREPKRRYREANREKIRAYGRVYQRARGTFKRHGLRPDQLAALWEAQDGLCCYCGRPLPQEGKVVVDHDHTCCPPMTSCARCRRGLAHNNCNVIAGMAGEDWDLLAAIASNGRELAAQVRERIKGGPIQEALPIDITPPEREAAS